MKISHLLPVFVLIVFFGCSDSDQRDSSKIVSHHEIQVDSIAILDESVEILGEIADIDFINKTSFVLATKSGLVVTYNTKGERISGFSKIGTGPFEYLMPSVLKVHNNKIYLWCARLLKLIVFDEKGNPIDEYSNFSRAIKDFAIVNNDVYFYMTGGSVFALIEQYSLDHKEFTDHFSQENRESEMLSMYTCAGGIVSNNNAVYFSPIGQLSIQSIVNDKLRVHDQISDDDFSVLEINDTDYSTLREDMVSRINYINKNSYVGGLYFLDNKLVVKTQVGFFNYEDVWDVKTWNTSNRFEKYYIFDEKLNLTDTYKRPFRFECKDCLFEANGTDLFYIIEKENTDIGDYSYQLNKIVFN